MDMIKRKATFLTAIMIVLLAFLSCNQERIKEQGEAEISEYQERFVYEEWDIDSSGSLGKQELTSGIFESLDINDNDFLSSDEWEGTKFYFEDNNYGAFNEWDLNNDGRLNKKEFETAVAGTDLYEQWDSRSGDGEHSTEIDDTSDTDQNLQ